MYARYVLAEHEGLAERFYVPFPAEDMALQEANPALNLLRSEGPELILTSQ